MSLKDIEKRIAEIQNEITIAENTETIDKLVEERKGLLEKKAELEALEERKAQAMAIQSGHVVVRPLESPKGDIDKNVRNTKEYIDAFAEYVKTGKDAECRSLLTTNVPTTGTIAVPDFVYDIIKTAWDKNEIMSLVKKVSVKGNLKVQFEISGTDAVIHDEGSGAVSEETLTEGIVTMVPKNIKKWISFSDEVMSMRGEAFLRYIYDELVYRITKKIADELVAAIVATDGSGSASSPKQSVVKVAPAMATVATAIGNLSDEATNPVIIMNKLTYAAFKTVQYGNGYGADPFEGLRVLFNNSLPAYSTASENDCYMIVGDLGYGALANFPDGDVVDIKVDELSKKKEDLIEVLGKEYVAVAVIACKAFCKVTKPAAL
jgi:HK97 family phage major capsid protein